MARLIKWPWELLVTGLLSLYFLIGFSLFWLPLFLFAAWRHREKASRAKAFQRLIQRFFKSFFSLMRLLCPGLRFDLDPLLFDMAGCVLVANHRSFFDPILLTSLFPRHGTVVKNVFFKVPIFGWVIKNAGYLPSGKDIETLRQRLNEMPDFIAQGGIFFIFPEGTRSRSLEHRLGPFKKGAFRIAQRSGADIQLLAIQGTGRLFPPDQIRVRAADRIHLRLKLVGRIEKETLSDPEGLSHQANEAQKRIEDACDP